MVSLPYISAIPVAWPRSKDVPYVSQKGNTPANDCGIACVLMLAKWLGKTGASDTVQKWAQIIDPEDNGTTAAQLADLLKRFQLTPVVGMAAIYPYIALVEYNRLPLANRSDQSGKTFAHWIVRLSDDTYSDPYHYGTAGANLKASAVVLNDAMGAAAQKYIAAKTVQKVGIVERPKEAQAVTPTNATIKAVSWNVRRGPTTQAESLGVLTKGDTVTVAGVTQASDGQWYAIPLQAGGVTIKQASDEKTPAIVYMRSDGFATSTSTPPTPTPQPTPVGPRAIGTHPALPALPFYKRIGIHMLTSGKPQLQEYIDAGCRAFTCLDNVAAAREARQAGAAAIFRRYINLGVIPDPVQFARGMGVDANDTLILMGINEADSISTSDLDKRFAWERAWALEAHRLYPKCFIVIGSFSMGTPQLENADVAKKFRDTYGAFLNANADWCGVNYHGYSGRPTPDYPPQAAPVIAPEWLEMRWLKYAYSPSGGGLSKDVVLVNDESGVDVAGTGGFSACGYSEETFGRWWSFRKSLYEAWPQQYIFNLFQGDRSNVSWKGYDVTGYTGKLRQIWSGADVRAPWLVGVADSSHYNVGGESPLANDWEPAPKVLVE